MLRFEVRGQYITRIDEEVPVAKCMNVFKARFDFLTEEWVGTKTAIFAQGGYSKSQILDENDECIVPWEFFDTEEKTRGYVSVYCGELMTANESKVTIAKSGYKESDASVPPTPDVYQQILENLDGKLDKAGHVPDKYLGTDSEGNVVEKEAPSGGGSGTTDYNSLENKPHINGVELRDEKTLEELGIQEKGNYASKEEIPTSLPASDVYDWAKEPEKPSYNADEVGAEEKGTVDRHNVSKETHQDIREILTKLEEKVKAIANSDDESLDTLAEIVAYIKSNKSLIDAITTGKVSTSDIVNDLITNAETKVLSAAQGVELKRQIDEVAKSIPKKLPNPHKLTLTGVVKAEYDGSGAVTVEIPDSSEEINAKLDKNQGAENAGKALVIGEDGDVVPGEAKSGDSRKLLVSYVHSSNGSMKLSNLDSQTGIFTTSEPHGLIENTSLYLKPEATCLPKHIPIELFANNNAQWGRGNIYAHVIDEYNFQILSKKDGDILTYTSERNSNVNIKRFTFEYNMKRIVFDNINSRRVEMIFRGNISGGYYNYVIIDSNNVKYDSRNDHSETSPFEGGQVTGTLIMSGDILCTNKKIESLMHAVTHTTAGTGYVSSNNYGSRKLTKNMLFTTGVSEVMEGVDENLLIKSIEPVAGETYPYNGTYVEIWEV